MTVTTIPQEITPPGSLDDLVPGMLIRCDGETLRYHGFLYHTDLPFDLSFSKPMPSERNHILMREEDGYPGVVNVAEMDKVERYVILEERDFTFQPFMGSSLGRWIIVHDQPEIDVKYSIVNQKSNGLHRKTSVFVTDSGNILMLDYGVCLTTGAAPSESKMWSIKDGDLIPVPLTNEPMTPAILLMEVTVDGVTFETSWG